jgi:ketosteroid isomerase-like protein
VSNALRNLADRAEISAVIARYCTALDTRDWELLREVFTPDAVRDGEAGVAEIIALLRRTLERVDTTQHLVGNLVVHLEGDVATATSAAIAQHVRAGAPGGPDYLVGARYSDRLVHTPTGWRITHRTIHRVWRTGNREVIPRT